MRINKNQLIYISLYTLLLFPLLFIANNLLGIFILSCVNLLYLVFILTKHKIQVLSLPMLFIILSFIFHCSQIGLALFKIDAFFPFDLSILVSSEIRILSLKYYFLTQYFIGFGYLLYLCFKKQLNFDMKNIKKNKNKNKNLESMGIVLFCIGLIPTILIDMSKLMLTMRGNYINSYDLYIPRIIVGIAYCFYIGIILIILANEHNKKKCNKILIFIFIYLFITLFTGNRASQLSLILMFLFIYMNKINTLKTKHIILIILAGYVLLSFIVALSAIRGINGEKIGLLLEEFGNVLIKTPFLDLFGELGGTMISLCYAIQYLPAHSYLFLFQPLLCVIGIIPGSSYLVSTINKNLYFVNNFPLFKQEALGGSYVGELYYLFGNTGYLVAPFIGILLMIIHTKIMSYLNSGSYYKFAKYAILYTSLLFYTRDYFFNVISNFIVITIILFIVKRIFNYNE